MRSLRTLVGRLHAGVFEQGEQPAAMPEQGGRQCPQPPPFRHTASTGFSAVQRRCSAPAPRVTAPPLPDRLPPAAGAGTIVTRRIGGIAESLLAARQLPLRIRDFLCGIRDPPSHPSACSRTRPSSTLKRSFSVCNSSRLAGRSRRQAWPPSAQPLDRRRCPLSCSANPSARLGQPCRQGRSSI